MAVNKTYFPPADHCQLLAEGVWQEARIAALTRDDRLSREPNVGRLGTMLGVLIAHEAKKHVAQQGLEKLAAEHEQLKSNYAALTQRYAAEKESANIARTERDRARNALHLRNAVPRKCDNNANDSELKRCIDSQLKLSEKLKDSQHICNALREENQRMAAELTSLSKYRRKMADEMPERVYVHKDILP